MADIKRVLRLHMAIKSNNLKTLQKNLCQLISNDFLAELRVNGFLVSNENVNSLGLEETVMSYIICI